MNKIYRRISKLKYHFPEINGRDMAINRIKVLAILSVVMLMFPPVLIANIKDTKDTKETREVKDTKESKVITVNNAEKADNADNEVAYDDLSVALQVEGLGGYSVNAIYSSKNRLFICVEDLFRTLKIPCEILQDGDLLRGFINKEGNKYTLNYTTQQLIAKVSQEF